MVIIYIIIVYLHNIPLFTPLKLPAENVWPSFGCLRLSNKLLRAHTKSATKDILHIALTLNVMVVSFAVSRDNEIESEGPCLADIAKTLVLRQMWFYAFELGRYLIVTWIQWIQSIDKDTYMGKGSVKHDAIQP